MTEAIFVMMNNYFHDLAVAFMWASSLMAHLVLRHWPGRPSEQLSRTLMRIAWGSLAWVSVGGAIRGWFYMDYEWLPAAGRDQIPALGVKHVLLFALTAWGLAAIVRLRRRLREEPEPMVESGMPEDAE